MGGTEAKAAREWVGGEGAGWVLGCDRAAEAGAFGGLVGAQGWSLAVTRGEYDDFVQARSCGQDICMPTLYTPGAGRWQLRTASTTNLSGCDPAASSREALPSKGAQLLLVVACH